MKKIDVVRAILQDKLLNVAQSEKVIAFAPTNIALCKYWGKRDQELNLPVTSSLSISLPDKGAETILMLHTGSKDIITVNGQPIHEESAFYKRTGDYLDLFRPNKAWFLTMHITSGVPIAAGLASSACGFAALIKALNELFTWQLSSQHLSILARLGSGSASRSLWNGFVEWYAGVEENGMDSYAESLNLQWPNLQVGLQIINAGEKAISSREAMRRTVDNSLFYKLWPTKIAEDLQLIKQAIKDKNFSLLGATAETNALAMHATMMTAWPPICYYQPETLQAMHKVWAMRKEGIEVYFTQDAGPNLKLLFLAENIAAVKEQFSTLEVVSLFDS